MLPQLLHLSSVAIQEDGPFEDDCVVIRVTFSLCRSLASLILECHILLCSSLLLFLALLHHFCIRRGRLRSLNGYNLRLLCEQVLFKDSALTAFELLEALVGLHVVPTDCSSSDAWERAEIEQVDAENSRLLTVENSDAHAVKITRSSTELLLIKFKSD